MNKKCKGFMMLEVDNRFKMFQKFLFLTQFTFNFTNPYHDPMAYSKRILSEICNTLMRSVNFYLLSFDFLR